MFRFSALPIVEGGVSGPVAAKCAHRGTCRADVMRGYNGTIFAYGQTGSGKVGRLLLHKAIAVTHVVATDAHDDGPGY